ncbi:ABC transporter [Metarhizium robertsii]|uniref:ABC transporter n=1 Tax=Metarhizium robertsii TaxID=568076 RepID=A0A0A1UWF3_9HYPO|nr:ABC transporter [Metarhizium robertsii]
MGFHQHAFRRLGFASCDGSFGPFAADCPGGRFDFTLLFELVVFEIVPSVILLMVVPFRIFRLVGQRPKVSASFGLYLKMALCFVFILLQISLLVTWRNIGVVVPARRVTLVASGLGVLDAAIITMLTYLEHHRSVRPSSMLCVYLLFSSLFDSVHCRTLWLLHNAQPLATIVSALLATKVALLLLESQNKTSILSGKGESLGPEATSGIISRSLLWWLNDLFLTGYGTTLSVEKLHLLDLELRSETLLHRMHLNWPRYRDSGKHALLRTLLSSTKAALLAGVVPRICYSAFKMSQPFLINRVIRLVQNQGTEGAYSPEVGYALIPATVFLYLGLAIGYSFSQQKVYRMLTAIRVSLTSFLLDNATDLESGAKESSAVLTLVTTDVGVIERAFTQIHELWATPIELGLALWFLVVQMGWGSVGPAIAVLFSFIGTFQLSKYMAPAVKASNEATQNRISNTSSVLGSMKEIKMLGLVEPWLRAIVRLHDIQMKRSIFFRKLITLMNLLGNTPSRFAPVLTFGIALLSFGSKSGEKFTVAKAFTAMSILGLVTGPLSWLMFSLPTLISSFASFTRLQDFIMTCEDSRVRYSDDVIPGELNGSGPGTGSGAVAPFGFLGDALIAAKDASIIFKTDDEAVLRDINLSIQPGSFTLVAGKVGSGKTVLLRGLLGQLQTKGYLKVYGAGAAYCAQTPWLMNATVRSNILGQSAMDNDWYKTVVSACALDRDLAQLPNGDMSLIGPNGLSLSGGQKQRIVLLTHMAAVHLIDRPDSVILLGDKGPGQVIQGPLDELKASTGIQALISSSREESSAHEDEIAQKGTLLKTAPRPPRQKDVDGKIDSKIRTSGDISLYLYYFKAIGTRKLMILLISEAANALTNIFPEIWLMMWTTANLKNPKTSNGWYFGIYTLAEVVGLALFGWSICKDHDIINQRLPLGLWLSVSGFFSLLTSTAMVLYGSQYLVIALPLIVIVVYCIQAFYLRTSRQLRHLDLEATAPLYSHLKETIDGISTIQAYGWVPAFEETSLRLLDNSQKPHYFLLGAQCWLKLVLELFVGSLAVTLITLAVMAPAGTSAGAIALGLVNVISLSSALVELISHWTSLEGSLGAIERLKSFETNTPQEVTSPQPWQPPEKWPSQGLVEFNKVTASYSANSGNDRYRALNSVTLSIRQGEKVAVCGRTGSGKSSLLLTLFRLLDPDSGTITVDGIDISNIPQNVLRPRLIAVPQEPMLFPGTLRTNICPGGGVDEMEAGESDEHIISCLQKVELWDKISAKGGLDSDVSDLGLSQGQKQLLCLARALIRKDISAVLVLDEAMSAVDRGTEELMVKVLEEEFAHHTVLSVVHRLNTVLKYDQVVVLDGGTVAEVALNRDNWAFQLEFSCRIPAASRRPVSLCHSGRIIVALAWQRRQYKHFADNFLLVCGNFCSINTGLQLNAAGI